jgi:sigma-E factor negative regulatory protein RseA
MVMGEEISRLMDGEIDDEHIDVVYAELKRAEGLGTWVCYHVIGDTLRGSGGVSSGFSTRFAARLAGEPTVLAPQTKPERQIASYAWAAAAGVAAVSLVGWVAFGTLDADRPAMAKAGEATTVRAAQLKPQTVPADYLFAHQEYSPTTQIQGVGPYLRAVSASASDARP